MIHCFNDGSWALFHTRNKFWGQSSFPFSSGFIITMLEALEILMEIICLNCIWSIVSLANICLVSCPVLQYYKASTFAKVSHFTVVFLLCLTQKLWIMRRHFFFLLSNLDDHRFLPLSSFSSSGYNYDFCQKFPTSVLSYLLDTLKN